MNSEYTILIVDDLPTNLEVLLEFLTQTGFEVNVALDGESAIEQAHYARPDLILLDVMMPVLDGFETCRRLKADEQLKAIPVIFMTALSETVDKVKGFSLGAVDYITKPLQHEEVLARVNTHLTLQRLQKQLTQQNEHLKILTERMQSELRLAHQIQQNLLATPSPAWPDLDVICYNAPAREVGGDFYAYHQHGTKYVLAVGDVSGKGMPAALLMAVSLTSLQNSIGQMLSPHEALAQLHQALLPYTLCTKQNCALVYVELLVDGRPQTVDHLPYSLLKVANAGCISPLIRRATGQLEWVEVGGVPLGTAAIPHHTTLEIPLQSGDMVLLISDGVVEATHESGEMFSFERFEQVVQQGPRGAAAMLTHLQQAIAAFVGTAEAHDDVTMVVIQI